MSKLIKQITNDEARLLAALWFMVAVFVTVWETVKTGHGPVWMVEVTFIYSASILGKDFIKYKWGGTPSSPVSQPEPTPKEGTGKGEDPNV